MTQRDSKSLKGVVDPLDREDPQTEGQADVPVLEGFSKYVPESGQEDSTGAAISTEVKSALNMAQNNAEEDDGSIEVEFFDEEKARSARAIADMEAIKDRVNYLCLREEHVKEAEDYDSRKKNGSTFKKLGQALLGAGKAVLTAIPRAIDALLPDKWQTTIKLEMYENLKAQKGKERAKLVEEFRADMTAIDSAYDQINRYVDQEYGKGIPQLNSLDATSIQYFIDECRGANPNSPHYMEVRSRVMQVLEKRTEDFNQKMAEIEADNSSEELAQEILESSWYLKLRERFSAKEKRAKQIDKPSWLNQNTYLPVTNTMITHGIVNKQAKLYDADNLPEHEENTQITNHAALRRVDKKRTGWLLAAAAALGLAGIGTYGVIKSGQNTRRSADQKDNSAELASSASIASAVLVEKTAPVSEPKAAPVLEQQKEAKTPEPAVIDSPKKPVKLAQIPSSKPKYAKTSVLPKLQPELKTEEKIDQTKAEEKELSDVEVTAMLRDAESRISAYNQRAKSIYNAPQAGIKYEAPDNSTLLAALDQYSKYLHEMREKGKITNSDRNRLSSIAKSVESEFGSIEKKRNEQIVPNYVAEAEPTVKLAQKKLDTVKGLLANRSHQFTIVHPVKSANGSDTSITYSVNIDEVSAKLATLEQKLKDSSHLNAEQAKLASMDAKYWDNYLSFVDWYLRYQVNNNQQVRF